MERLSVPCQPMSSRTVLGLANPPRDVEFQRFPKRRRSDALEFLRQHLLSCLAPVESMETPRSNSDRPGARCLHHDGAASVPRSRADLKFSSCFGILPSPGVENCLPGNSKRLAGVIPGLLGRHGHEFACGLAPPRHGGCRTSLPQKD